VGIYLSLPRSPERLIAVTDERGHFYSDLIDVPHNETATVRAVLTHYVFSPADHSWYQTRVGEDYRRVFFTAYYLPPDPRP
jgi:hypothetical protein